MKKGILFFLLLLHVFSATAQLLVRYQECTTCDTNGQNSSVTYQYGALSEYEAIKVADDYGVRIDGDKWHGGVDYNSQKDSEGGAGDRGDLIIAIEGGTIGGELDDGYKRLFVNGAHDFGYGHMFWGSQSNTQSGGCYLRKLIDTSNDWAVILVVDGDTTAIGPTAGNVSFGGDTLSVQTTIEAGGPIGPTGGSSDGSELGPHMHLYSNPDGSTSTNDEITKNPLQYVQYADTTFEVKILKQNDTDEGITLAYPGTVSTTIQVRPKLQGQPTSTKRYPKILDADQVEIFLKRSDNPTYERIRGPYFESNLCLGGRIGGPVRYPRNADAPGNANSPWYNTETQWGRTGIHPYAYRGDDLNKANPWDDYYYADFVTRIHKDDPMDGDDTPTMIADCPQNARYNDGRYELKAVVRDVQGTADGAGRCAVIEMWGYHIGPTYTDRQYGLNHSNTVSLNPSFIEATRHIFLLEKFIPDPTSPNPHFWIPKGVMLDCIDDNSLNPPLVVDGVVSDNVTGYSQAHCFQSISDGPESVEAVRDKLKTLLPPGVSASSVDALFFEYGF